MLTLMNFMSYRMIWFVVAIALVALLVLGATLVFLGAPDVVDSITASSYGWYQISSNGWYKIS